MNNGRILQAAAAQEHAQAMIEAEMRAVCRDIFKELAAPYLVALVSGNVENPDPAKALRGMSSAAWKAAQYCYTAAGIVNVDDEKLWPVRTIQ